MHTPNQAGGGEDHRNDSSIWHVVEEKREFKLSDGKVDVYEVNGIRRADGMTITREGVDREKFETFLCKGNFGQFKFYACRWDGRNNAPSDKYVVHLIPNRGITTEADVKLCKSFSRDVESALLHLPVSLPFFNKLPVNEVVFNTGTWINPKLVHAEEAEHVNL